jgi:hypothetical protein
MPSAAVGIIRLGKPAQLTYLDRGGGNRSVVDDSLANFDDFEAIVAHRRPGQMAP